VTSHTMRVSVTSNIIYLRRIEKERIGFYFHNLVFMLSISYSEHNTYHWKSPLIELSYKNLKLFLAEISNLFERDRRGHLFTFLKVMNYFQFNYHSKKYAWLL